MSFTIGAKGKSGKTESMDRAVVELLLEDICRQLKLVNLNLSRLNGENLTEQDLEE
jgi:hypothetical protein